MSKLLLNLIIKPRQVVYAVDRSISTITTTTRSINPLLSKKYVLNIPTKITLRQTSSAANSPSATNDSNKNEPKNRILTIPNALTISRIVSIPFISYFLFVDQHQLACGLFVAAAITDFLDGNLL